MGELKKGDKKKRYSVLYSLVHRNDMGWRSNTGSVPLKLLCLSLVCIILFLIMWNMNVQGSGEQIILDPLHPFYISDDIVYINGILKDSNGTGISDGTVGITVFDSNNAMMFATQVVSNESGVFSTFFTIPNWTAYGNCTIYAAYMFSRTNMSFLYKEIIPPEIVDTTPTQGFPGESLMFNATVTDNVEVSGVYVEYWYGNGTSVNVSMGHMSGDAWSLSILVDNTTENLSYIISAYDLFDNWNNTMVKVINITDIKEPVIGDNTPGSATTGDTFTFNATVYDNVGVNQVYVEFWYGSGNHTNVSMVLVGGDFWEFTLILENTLDTLHYIISANDSSNNWNNTGIHDVTMVDNDKPILIPQSPSLPIIPDDTDEVPKWHETSTLFIEVTDICNITSVVINLSSIGRGIKTMSPVGSTGVWYIETNATKGSAVWDSINSVYIPHQFLVNATDEYGNWNVTYLELTVWKNGDVSGNGMVNMFDCVFLARHLIGIPGYAVIIPGVAEVSGNAAVNMFDASYLARHLVGMPGYEVLQ